LPTSLVAIISIPVMATFLIITAPIFTGALTDLAFKAFMTSGIFAFGIGPEVLTLTSGHDPWITRTEDVSVRFGCKTSSRA
jgi:hypothetical protein